MADKAEDKAAADATDPATLLKDVEIAALTLILPNLQAVDQQVKALENNDPFSLEVAQTAINNIAGQGLIIEAEAPVLIPVIAGAVSQALAGEADTELQSIITWVQQQSAAPATPPAAKTGHAHKK